MSKKKRSKKRERIPVIDTLIDLAGAMTLDYLAAKRRQENGTKRSKKIDPYAATGAAMLMYGREAQSKTRIASPATIPKSGERNRKIHSCMLYLISI